MLIFDIFEPWLLYYFKKIKLEIDLAGEKSVFRMNELITKTKILHIVIVQGLTLKYN